MSRDCPSFAGVPSRATSSRLASGEAGVGVGTKNVDKFVISGSNYKFQGERRYTSSSSSFYAETASTVDTDTDTSDFEPAARRVSLGSACTTQSADSSDSYLLGASKALSIHCTASIDEALRGASAGDEEDFDMLTSFDDQLDDHDDAVRKDNILQNYCSSIERDFTDDPLHKLADSLPKKSVAGGLNFALEDDATAKTQQPAGVRTGDATAAAGEETVPGAGAGAGATIKQTANRRHSWGGNYNGHRKSDARRGRTKSKTVPVKRTNSSGQLNKKRDTSMERAIRGSSVERSGRGRSASAERGRRRTPSVDREGGGKADAPRGRGVSVERKKKAGVRGRKKKPSTTPGELTKPKRAMSAYNYFFSAERAKFLGTNVPELSTEKKDATERAHRRTHGKIGFTDLAKLIGQRWKELDEKDKIPFQEKAQADLVRYRAEMDDYTTKLRASGSFEAIGVRSAEAAGLPNDLLRPMLGFSGYHGFDMSMPGTKSFVNPYMRTQSLTDVVGGHKFLGDVMTPGPTSLAHMAGMTRSLNDMSHMLSAAPQSQAPPPPPPPIKAMDGELRKILGDEITNFLHDMDDDDDDDEDSGVEDSFDPIRLADIPKEEMQHVKHFPHLDHEMLSSIFD